MTPQAIRYPTDLSLLNEGPEFSEQIIDNCIRRPIGRNPEPIV